MLPKKLFWDLMFLKDMRLKKFYPYYHERMENNFGHGLGVL